jgi:hypothetical protein
VRVRVLGVRGPWCLLEPGLACSQLFVRFTRTRLPPCFLADFLPNPATAAVLAFALLRRYNLLGWVGLSSPVSR